MGYTTVFEGEFAVEPQLSPKHREYLLEFAGTRRMRRDEALARLLPDVVREAVELPVGPEGGYFVGAGGVAGQEMDRSVLDYNRPPMGQPSLWCQWIPGYEGRVIHWDGGEKFYNYVEWLQYLVDNFLRPWGYRLNGEVEWSGEETRDVGRLVVRDNMVLVNPPEDEEEDDDAWD